MTKLFYKKQYAGTVMKVILLSIHAMEDDRIRRHIHLFDVGIDVYYLHYMLLSLN